LRIQDLEHYLRSRGIEAAPDRQDREILAREAAEQTNAARRYQDEIHKRIFENDEEGGEGEENDRKDETDERFLNALVLVRMADGTEMTADLSLLTESCVFVRSMARFVSSSSSQAYAGDGGDAIEDCDGNPSESPTKKRLRTPLVLSLEEFEASAAKDFLSIVLKDMKVGDIAAESVVECYRIAHYLQCPAVMAGIVPVLTDSVDSQNCMSMCQLADSLGIPALYESAVNQMITSLEDIENHELWEDMPKTLQVRVITMQNAVRSSLLSRGTKTGVFFSCGEEFLAILSDNIREQRERLAEAKRRQLEVVKERAKRERIRQLGIFGRRLHGDDVDFSSVSSDEDLLIAGSRMWRSVKDAQEKIDRQEQRIETLDSFYREQKVIFEGAGWLKEKTGGFIL